LAFQEAGWKSKIPNPFALATTSAPTKLLRNTLKNLNRRLPLLLLSCDEKGRFVSWHRRLSTPKYTRK
jgi:hypothetical protein